MTVYEHAGDAPETHTLDLSFILDSALALPGVRGGAIVDMDTGLELARSGLAETQSVSLVRARGTAIRKILCNRMKFGSERPAEFLLLSLGDEYQMIFTLNQAEGDEGLFVCLVLAKENRFIPPILTWLRNL